MKKLSPFILLLLFCPVVGCRVFDTYTPPVVSVPDVWKESSDDIFEEQFQSEELWWNVFEEEELTALINQAMASNFTLEEAFWRIVESQTFVQRERSFWYPTIDFNPNTQNTVQKLNFPGQSLNNLGSQRSKTTQYQLPFNGFYNFDLWGQIGYKVDSAISTSEAEAYAYQNTTLELQASVAETYFTIRSLDTQNIVLTNTIKVRQDALEINTERYRVGIANYIDVSQAQTELELAKADLAQNHIERALQEHSLAVLLGGVPAEFELKEKPLKNDPPALIPIIPCEVLMMRPDVREAERRLKALFSDEGVAYTAFFPSVSLSAQIGYQSNLASDLLQWQSRLWSLALSALQVVFDGGLIQADFDAAQARFRQGLASYAQTTLNAIKEVEDGLARTRWLTEQYQALNHATESSQATTSLAEDRYLHGLDNYLQVVTAERTLLLSQLAAARTLGDRYVATVRLIQSMGGQSFEP